MSYKTNDFTLNTLINFTKEGVVVASYQEIRNTIVNAFKQIYGEDIDLASSSADGVYVETLSLMISNILQSFKQYYAQLDVRTASGVYLENLCALSNVRRKSATYSNCRVQLTLSDTETNAYVTKEISLADKNGNIWTCSSDANITFEPGKAKELVFTCEEIGPVVAQKGWIDKTVDTEKTFDVLQVEDANIGSYSESDSNLRARRNSSLGSTGTTVLETMIGALYELSGIQDVKIYNNNTENAIIALDGTTIDVHNVYVVIRRQQNIDITDRQIGNIIYEKLTPGIRTEKSTSDTKYGVSKEYVYSFEDVNIPIEQKVYWKEAKPITPKCVITITPMTNYSETTSKQIAAKVIDYLNNIKLSGQVTIYKLMNIISCADSKYRGQDTFSLDSVTLDNSTSTYTLPDTYFYYNIDSDVTYDDTTNKIVITLGK